MLLLLLIVVPLGLAGIVSGAFAILRSHGGAAKASAGLGLLTMGTAVAVHGWQLMRAFEAVATVPADVKQSVLAAGISDAMTTLPVGFGLGMASALLSAFGWSRARRAEQADPEDA